MERDGFINFGVPRAPFSVLNFFTVRKRATALFSLHAGLHLNCVPKQMFRIYGVPLL